MTADAGMTGNLYTETGELRGVWTRGGEPKELVLSDGSRLSLTDGERGRVRWCRVVPDEARDETLSVDRAKELAGEEFDGYVHVRTRSEAGWLREVADWCAGEADRLEGELDNSRTGA